MNRLTLQNVVFWVLMLLLGFLIFSIFWADYVYYKVNYREKENLLVRPADKILTSEDIVQVTDLLDERAKLLQELMQKSKGEN